MHNFRKNTIALWENYNFPFTYDFHQGKKLVYVLIVSFNFSIKLTTIFDISKSFHF